MRMIHQADRLCLLLKPFDRFAVLDKAWMQQFDRHRAIQLQVPGAKHRTKPARAKPFNELVPLVYNAAGTERKLIVTGCSACSIFVRRCHIQTVCSQPY